MINPESPNNRGALIFLRANGVSVVSYAIFNPSSFLYFCANIRRSAFFSAKTDHHLTLTSWPGELPGSTARRGRTFIWPEQESSPAPQASPGRTIGAIRPLDIRSAIL